MNEKTIWIVVRTRAEAVAVTAPDAEGAVEKAKGVSPRKWGAWSTPAPEYEAHVARAAGPEERGAPGPG